MLLLDPNVNSSSFTIADFSDNNNIQNWLVGYLYSLGDFVFMKNLKIFGRFYI